MSDVIRAMGMGMSQNGACRKCGQPRESGSHSKCDRWPMKYGISKGFHFVGNSDLATVGELKKIIAAIVAGESDSQPLNFDIRVRAMPDSEVTR